MSLPTPEVMKIARPASLSRKQRIERADQPPVRGDIHRHHLVPDFWRDMAERRELPEHAGIGDQDVELLPALEDRRAKPVDRLVVSEVEGNQRRRAAELADGVVEFFQPADRARHGHDMCAGRRQPLAA